MKERLTALLLLILAVLTAWAVTKKHPSIQKAYGTIVSQDAVSSSASLPLSDEVVRLHILADSDRPEDQHIKLAVRDALLPYLAAVTQTATSKTEALDELKNQKVFLTEIANRTLSELGANYQACISIDQIYFPIRIYGSQTYLSEDATVFPPGFYDSIQIVLGAGNGHNWWCLAYPSLCFIDATYEYVPKNSSLYKEKFSTVKESSLHRLFYGKATEDSCNTDASVDIFLDFKLWNLFSSKIRQFMLH
ncbi:MAG: hypothetical protein E7260_12045 [Lachnospiraceae bacterium]|nr:hypothetical protein [Lachnospiraceae bacterium]